MTGVRLVLMTGVDRCGPVWCVPGGRAVSGVVCPLRRRAHTTPLLLPHTAHHWKRS